MLARVGCALGEKMPTLSHVSGRHAEHRASCWLPRKGALLHRTFMHVVVGGICIQLGLDLRNDSGPPLCQHPLGPTPPHALGTAGHQFA
jgi:hypothetical protein